MTLRHTFLLWLLLLAARDASAVEREFFVQARLGLAHHQMDDDQFTRAASLDLVVVDRFTGDHFAPGSTLPDRDLGLGFGASFLTGFRLDQRWWLGLGLERLDVRDRDESLFGGNDPWAVNLSAWSLVAHVGREFRRPENGFDLVPALEFGVIAPSVDRRDQGIDTDAWDGRPIPTIAGLVTVQRWLAHDAALTLEGGFRYARSERDGVELNYSGVLFRVGVRLVR